jgi:hypothetical protein
MHVSKLTTLTNSLSVLSYRHTKSRSSCVSVEACKATVNIPSHCQRCRDRRLKPTIITQQQGKRKYDMRKSGVMISVSKLRGKMKMNGHGKFFRVAQNHSEIGIRKTECIKWLLSPRRGQIFESTPSSMSGIKHAY